MIGWKYLTLAKMMQLSKFNFGEPIEFFNRRGLGIPMIGVVTKIAFRFACPSTRLIV